MADSRCKTNNQQSKQRKLSLLFPRHKSINVPMRNVRNIRFAVFGAFSLIFIISFVFFGGHETNVEKITLEERGPFCVYYDFLKPNEG